VVPGRAGWHPQRRSPGAAYESAEEREKSSPEGFGGADRVVGQRDEAHPAQEVVGERRDHGSRSACGVAARGGARVLGL
jgi:hypothetical protein